LRVEGDRLRIEPCIPRRWPGFQIDFHDDGNTLYVISVENPHGVCRGVRDVVVDGAASADRSIPRLRDGKRHDVRVVLGDGA
jgi:cyclic beta-1,2-glucan synthetase